MPQRRGSRALALLAAVAVCLAGSTAVEAAKKKPAKSKAAKARPDKSKADKRYRVTHETAIALYDDGNYDDALIGFRRAYEIKPEPAALFMMARCHHAAGRKVEAVGAYERYLAETDDHPDLARAKGFLVELLHQVAETHLEAGELAKARDVFERSLLALAAAAPAEPVARGTLLAGLGDAFAGLGNDPEARDAYERGLATSPEAHLRARLESSLERVTPHEPTRPRDPKGKVKGKGKAKRKGKGKGPLDVDDSPGAAAYERSGKRKKGSVFGLAIGLSAGGAVLIAGGIVLGVLLASPSLPDTDLGFMTFPP